MKPEEREMKIPVPPAKGFIVRIGFEIHRVLSQFRGGIRQNDMVILVHPESLHEMHGLMDLNDTRWQRDRMHDVLFMGVRVVVDARVNPKEFRMLVDFAAIDRIMMH